MRARNSQCRREKKQNKKEDKLGKLAIDLKPLAKEQCSAPTVTTKPGNRLPVLNISGFVL